MNAPLTLTGVRRIHGRAVLTLSTGETLSMPRAMLRERPYRGGTPFDRESFNAFLRERAYPFAMEKAVALLASRARTEKEVADALLQNAYPEQIVARVIAQLHEAGYLDDGDFAGQWAASRTARGLGERRIRMELRQKGVDPDTIERALSAVNEEKQMDGALKAAQKAARGRDMTQRAEQQKVLAALARRGYDYSVARAALEQVLENR